MALKEDVQRMNEVTRLAVNGKRGQCKTDEEREFYDDVRSEMAIQQKYGIGIDMAHDAPE